MAMMSKQRANTLHITMMRADAPTLFIWRINPTIKLTGSKQNIKK
jgi:hypothetical protein